MYDGQARALRSAASRQCDAGIASPRQRPPTERSARPSRPAQMLGPDDEPPSAEVRTLRSFSTSSSRLPVPLLRHRYRAETSARSWPSARSRDSSRDRKGSIRADSSGSMRNAAVAHMIRDRSGRQEAPGAARLLPTGAGFLPPPIDPCMRFSLTRLTDVLLRRHSAIPARPGWAGARRWSRRGGSGLFGRGMRGPQPTIPTGVIFDGGWPRRSRVG